MGAKPVNGRRWRKVPLICVAVFSTSVACGKWRQGKQQNMVDLSSSDLGNSKHTSSWNYHAPWFEMSTVLWETWVWNSSSRTGLLHLTVVHRLSWIQGVTLNTQCHGLIIAAKHARNEVTWNPSHLLILFHLFSSHQGTLTKEMNVGWNCPE
jgi:hypothetical protein